MSRAKSGIVSKRRHKKILKLAKGYKLRNKNCFRIANERVEKAMQYAYRDRRVKKRNFRSLWIQRINAAVRQHGILYSQFIHGLQKLKIDIDRKMLSELAINNSDYFQELVLSVQKVLKAK